MSQEVTERKSAQREPIQLLRGARAIAAFVFGDPREARAVYGLAGELGLFRLRGMLCGRPETIAAAIAERERKALAAQTERARPAA